MAGAPARGRRAAIALTTVVVLPVTVGGTALGINPRGVLTGAGAFLDFWAGVITLLSLTATVIWGQISTVGALLSPRQRLWAQAVHRATGVLGLCFLALHILVKIAYGEVSAGGLLPGAADRERLYIGLGATAAYLFVASAVVGAARSAFAPGRKATRRWRLLHSCGYLAWCAALVHGLKAGRPVSSPLVTFGYAACLVVAALVLLMRVVRPGRPAPAPSGRPEPAAAPVSGRRTAEPAALPPAALPPAVGPADRGRAPRPAPAALPPAGAYTPAPPATSPQGPPAPRPYSADVPMRSAAAAAYLARWGGGTPNAPADGPVPSSRPPLDGHAPPSGSGSWHETADRQHPEPEPPFVPLPQNGQ
ncbi:hypothetical protein [Mangrovactinospora gilvigrisea]|nr:hypothetical protein [Mangrovactinospora gilvigrisea]